MAVAQAPVEDGLEPGQPDVEGTPSSDSQQPAPPPAQPKAPSKPASPPVDVRNLQAGFTQATQSLSQVRESLGLPKTATGAEIAQAIASLKQPAVLSEYSDDPVLAERHARLLEDEWTSVGRTYGDDLAVSARQISETAMTTGDPRVIAAALYEAAQALATPSDDQSAPDEESAAADQGEDEEVPDLEMEQPSGGLGLRQPPPELTEGLEGTGDFRTFFERMRGRAGR